MYLTDDQACNVVGGALQVAPSSGGGVPAANPVPPSVAAGVARVALVNALCAQAQAAFCALNSRAPVSFTSMGPAVVADVAVTNDYASGPQRCGTFGPMAPGPAAVGASPGAGMSPGGSPCALDVSDAPVVDALNSGLPYAAQPPSLTTSQPINLPPGAGLGGYRRGGLAGARRSSRGLRGTGFPDWGDAYGPVSPLSGSGNEFQDAVQNVVSWVTSNPAVSGLLALGLVAAVASMDGVRRG